MNKLISISNYAAVQGICERTVYRQMKEKDIKSVKIGTERYVVNQVPDEETVKQIITGKKGEWNSDILRASVIYKQHGGACKETREIIDEILEDMKRIEKLTGQKIKGYDRRSLQMKIKSGKTERKMRADKFSVRNRILNNDATFIKSLELIDQFWMQDPLHRLNNAIDRAIYEAKQREGYWEVAAINYYTLRRQVRQVIKQSGLANVHEYVNHLNLNKKKNAYVQGAFTDDIDFMEVFSLDDHKFDVAGTIEINKETGEKQLKKIYSWVCIEMKTMMILGYEIKAEPFNDSDIIRMMMKVLKKWGAPTGKVICDQGLGADRWVKDFFTKLGIVLEPQAAYSPTKKANNERIFRFFKEEVDVYCENFTGSNHAVEGRHRGLELSPEETTELLSEAKSRYDKYINTYYMDRPRKRNIPGIRDICDNTGRVSIRRLFEHYSQQHKKIEVREQMMRYAYMKDDYIKGFDGYYMKFKGELYLEEQEMMSLVIYDNAYKYQIAYNPDDLNTIDLYAVQDIMDRLTGRIIEKGGYVCTLTAIRSLNADEKAKAVAKHNKRVKKAILELARAYREGTGEIVNMAISGDGELVDIKKQEEKAIAEIIKYSLPVEKIKTAIQQVKQPVNIDNIEEMTFDGLEELVHD
jgi:hypothetical protein